MNDKSEHLLSLYRDIIFCHYHLQAYGKKLGAVTPNGLAVWSLLTSISQEKQMTIPQLAKQRSVSRQYIQKTIKALMAEDLVEFIDNPNHKKSKYLILTSKGQQKLTEIHQILIQETNKVAGDLEVDLNVLSHDMKKIKTFLKQQIKA